jgi:hypothetical protein
VCELGGGFWGILLVWNLQSGPTPRGRDDSAARIEVERVLRSTSASTLFIIAIVRDSDVKTEGPVLKIFCRLERAMGRCHQIPS